MRVNLRLVSYVIGLVVLASLFFNYASLWLVIVAVLLFILWVLLLH